MSSLSKTQLAQFALYQNPYLFLEIEETPEVRPKASSEQLKMSFVKQQNPHAFSDFFGEGGEPISSKEGSVHDSAISREELEKLLDEVLDFYKPYVARDHWAQVMQYRSIFLDEASRNMAAAKRIADRLGALRFTLMPGEQVEYNRAPAVRIIAELKRLLEE